jgi:hypothetical protein
MTRQARRRASTSWSATTLDSRRPRLPGIKVTSSETSFFGEGSQTRRYTPDETAI